jgi:hypothetical protein
MKAIFSSETSVDFQRTTRRYIPYDGNLVHYIINYTFLSFSIADWWFSLQPPAHAGSPLADFSTLNMEAIHSPKRRLTQDIHSATSRRRHSSTQFFFKPPRETLTYTMAQETKYVYKKMGLYRSPRKRGNVEINILV